MAGTIKDHLTPQWWAVADCVDAYETRRDGGFPDLRSFAERLPPADRLTGLAELVKIELELRWRTGERKHVEDFLREYPELKDPSVSLEELAVQESLVRSRSGDPPTLDELQSRFPSLDSAKLLPPGQGLIATIALGDSKLETKRSDSQDAVPSIPGTIDFDSQRSQPTGPATVDAPSASASSASSSQVAPAATPSASSSVGEKIGRYEVRQQLGAGSFGVVVRCFDSDLKRDVAIKLPLRQGPPSAERLKEFLHEAQSAARLRHPGIVTVLDAGQTDNGVFIVYEFIRGTTLQSRLEAGNFSLDDVVRWVAGTAEALHHAHKNGIVHRDIKPANILLDEESRPHIADFGLAKMDDQFFKNDAGRVLGTAAYMSPEQATGRSHWASPQTDIYSLGVMLYQMLTKRLPFGGRTLSELLDQVKQRVPSPPRTIDDKIPKPLEDICLKAMAKNPADRYSTAADMAAALRVAAAGAPPARRGLWVIGGLAGAAAAAAIAFILISSNSNRDSNRPGDNLHGGPQGNTVPAAAGVSLEPSIPFDPTWPRLEVDYQAAKDEGVWHVLNRNDILHEGDKVQMHVTLGVPRYVYLVWYDVEGKPTIVWPRDPNDQTKTIKVDWPKDKNDWEKIDSQRGAEFLLVAARDEKLQGDELVRFESQLPYAKDAVRLDAVYPVGSAALSRGLAGITHSRKDPLEPAFEETLGKTFSAYHGLVIPHQAVAVESKGNASAPGRPN
jgi:serine/threonine protein kinase